MDDYGINLIIILLSFAAKFWSKFSVIYICHIHNVFLKKLTQLLCVVKKGLPLKWQVIGIKSLKPLNVILLCF